MLSPVKESVNTFQHYREPRKFLHFRKGSKFKDRKSEEKTDEKPEVILDINTKIDFITKNPLLK